MGKVVKYCAACEESFAEKFGFCPNCGKPMEAFEMSPVMNNAPETAKIEPVAAVSENTAAETFLPEPYQTSTPVEPTPVAGTTAAFSNVGETQLFQNAPAEEETVEPVDFNSVKTANFDGSMFGNPTVEYSAKDFENFTSDAAVADGAIADGGESFTAPVVDNAVAVGSDYNNQSQAKDYVYQTKPIAKNSYNDGGFNVTVIKESNGKQRNLLLLGALAVMLTLTAGGMIYSIFNHPLLVGAIGDDLSIYVPVVDDEPMPVDPPEKKDKEKAGGGGGSGKEEETPTSKGRLAPQMPDPPLILPSKTIPQKDNFELKMQATTVGNKQVKPSDENYGDPNSKFTLGSDGTGKGGGQGSGVGTGQGSGRGSGQGSGLGSGSGGGVGTGNGNDRGSGDEGRNPPPPPPVKPQPVGVTEKIKFISKPRAGYTDEARTNQIQGTVRVRVQFLPSGQIGSVSPVSGLPYGLTEQAIAAAKQIRFEPAKKNGVPIQSVAIVEYNFNIY